MGLITHEIQSCNEVNYLEYIRNRMAGIRFGILSLGNRNHSESISRKSELTSDAPYLGEAAVLFALTRMPVIVGGAIEQVKMPGFVYIGIFLFICLGFIAVPTTIIKTMRIYKSNSLLRVPYAHLQFSIWFALVITAVLIRMILSVSFGLIILLIAQLIPSGLKKQSRVT